MAEEVLKYDFMVKRAQMRSKVLNFDNYKSRWFKLTKTWLYYCDGKLEVMMPIVLLSIKTVVVVVVVIIVLT